VSGTCPVVHIRRPRHQIPDILGRCIKITVKLMALLASGGAHAQQCPGPPPGQSHPVGNFNFVTNSHADRGHNGYRTFWACVNNLDRVNDLRIIWYVPTLNGWVLPGQAWDFHGREKTSIQTPLMGVLAMAMWAIRPMHSSSELQQRVR
jgi:hypothetical protein